VGIGILDSSSLVDQASCLYPLVEMLAVCLMRWKWRNKAELTEGRDSLVASFLIFMTNKKLYYFNVLESINYRVIDSCFYWTITDCALPGLKGKIFIIAAPGLMPGC
jgi:hypothetical protein